MDTFDPLADDAVNELGELTLADYSKTVMPIAKKVESDTGLPALVGIAHSANESRNGNSGLCRKGMNLFGVVSSQSWISKGLPTINMGTEEFINGRWIQTGRDFRRYNSWYESFQDWSHILSTVSLYAQCTLQLKDPKQVVNGMKCYLSVWATDPKASDTVLSIYNSLLSMPL